MVNGNKPALVTLLGSACKGHHRPIKLAMLNGPIPGDLDVAARDSDLVVFTCLNIE